VILLQADRLVVENNNSNNNNDDDVGRARFCDGDIIRPPGYGRTTNRTRCVGLCEDNKGKDGAASTAVAPNCHSANSTERSTRRISTIVRWRGTRTS
jgi:hypothetical protein